MVKIFFDMDGTIANLYQRPQWLEKIQNEEAGLFLNLPSMYSYGDWKLFQDSIHNTFEEDYHLGIITWLPMNASQEYCELVEYEKREWANNHLPHMDEFHALSYGTPKQMANTRKSTLMILIDDNPEVLAMWETKHQRKGILRTPNITLDDIYHQIVRLQVWQMES